MILSLAKEKLHSTKVLLDADEYKDSIERSYYTMFSIIRAILALDEVDFSTSFDFAIWQYNSITGSNNIIFKQNTAIFTGDGSTATYFGQQYTLHFSFPDVTSIVVTGFEPTEGITYSYNGIPGHKFS